MKTEIIQGLENAIQYVEENLSNDISIGVVAKSAFLSTYDFQRIFSAVAGIPVSQYIRRRKMSNAAFDIRNTSMKITEIALKYGYRSPTAFTRAFHSVHGIAPSDARSKDMVLSVFPRIHFEILVSGGEQIKYCIKNKEGFRIIGFSHSLTLDQEKNFTEIPAFWKKIKNDNRIDKLYNLMDRETEGLIGATIYNSPNDIKYVIGVASTKKAPSGVEAYKIPASLWVSLQCTGTMPDSMQDLYKSFFTDWLPTTDYKYTYGPDIEIYDEGDNINSSMYKCSLWMPITR